MVARVGSCGLVAAHLLREVALAPFAEPRRAVATTVSSPYTSDSRALLAKPRFTRRRFWQISGKSATTVHTPTEVTRRVTTSGLVCVSYQQVSAGRHLAGQVVTVRLQPTLLQVFFAGTAPRR